MSQQQAEISEINTTEEIFLENEENQEKEPQPPSQDSGANISESCVEQTEPCVEKANHALASEPCVEKSDLDKTNEMKTEPCVEKNVSYEETLHSKRKLDKAETPPTKKIKK